MVAVAMLTAITSLLPSYSVWLTLSVLAISSLIYWFGVSSYGLISHVSLPGPKPWPYVGNLIETVRYGGLHKALLEYSKKYGRVYKMYLGRDPIITVADPEILKHILVKDFDKFRNRPEFISGNPPLNKGLFGARDDNWKRVRSIVTPTFSSHKLKEIVPLIQEAVDALMEKFENFAKNEESVDLSTPFGRLTLDIILSAGFGLKAQIQTSPDTELSEKSLSIFSVPVYIRALTMFPFYRQIKRYFNLNPILHVPYFTNLAKEVLKIRRNSSIGRRDLVQLMLEAHDKNVNEVNTLTDEEIIGQCIVFLAAGSETTGASLAFIGFYLANNPEVQNKLLKEIDLAVQCRDDVPTFEFVQNIEYLDRVVCEVLRLCTVGYVNVRQCMETCVIKGIEFPAGVTVNIPSFVIHRDPEFWAKPEEFDPDRFLAEETEKRPAFSYLPFGLGPKQCIATRMALLEIKMALVTILQKFRFEKGVGTTEKLEFRAGTILQPREPIKAKIVFRSSSDKQ